MPEVQSDTAIQTITLETPAVTGYRFLGIIIADEVRTYQRKDGGVFHKWHLAVRPVDYPIGGQTGAWHMYAPVSTFKGSPMMLTVESLKTVFGSRDGAGNVRDIMKGQLCGLVGHFLMQDLTTERKGRDPIVFERHIGAVGAADEEETQRARGLPVYEPPPEVASAASETITDTAGSTNGATNLTPEQLTSLATLYSGRSEIDALREAVANSEFADVLPFVRNSSGLKALEAAGMAAVGSDGRIAIVGA